MTDPTVEAVVRALEVLTEPGTRTLRELAQAVITAHLDALEAQGMVVVPMEPTEAMRKEAYHGPIVSWQAMIAAWQKETAE